MRTKNIPIRQRTEVRSTFHMPRRCRLNSALLSAALALFTHAAFAQAWQTVDDFQYSLGTNSAAYGLAKDPTGTIIYSAGYGQDAYGVSHALAFQSLDGGTTWSLLDDCVDPTSSPGHGPEYASIAADGFGNIYAAGDYLGSEGWFTQGGPYQNGGWSPSPIDSVSLANPSANAIATDSKGNVYVAGGSNVNWVVRKGTVGSSGGISWVNVDTLGTSSSASATASGVFYHPTKGVFAVGSLPVVTKQGVAFVWTVRRSQDGGATWTTVDPFQLSSGYDASALGVGGDPLGNIYVVGGASAKTHTGGHWIVRKSGDGGNSWSTIDNMAGGSAYAIASDAQGNLFVAGVSSYQWLVRSKPVGSSTWSTVDTFQYPSGRPAYPSAVIVNNSGNVLVAGQGIDAAGVLHWIVRRR